MCLCVSLGSRIFLPKTNVLVARLEVNTNMANIYGYQVLVALGSGAFIQAGYSTIQTVIKPADTSYGIAYMMMGKPLFPAPLQAGD